MAREEPGAEGRTFLRVQSPERVQRRQDGLRVPEWQNTAEDDKEVTCVCHLGRLSFIFLAGIREARPPHRSHSLLCDSNLSDARRGALLQPRQAPPKSRLPITEKQALFCRAP